MVALRWIISTALAASTAIANDFPAAEVFIDPVLVRRQDQTPGSPSYNCHDSCGQAIIEARNCNATICDDQIFQDNYQNCLQCAGPENEDIWRYYGDSLGAAAASCDLATEPLAGEQDDVGAAVAASNSTAGCEAAAAAGVSSSSASASATGASASASATGASASASATEASASASASASSGSASASASDAAASASGTASSAANAGPTAAAGFAAYGAIAVGALYGLGL